MMCSVYPITHLTVSIKPKILLFTLLKLWLTFGQIFFHETVQALSSDFRL